LLLSDPRCSLLGHLWLLWSATRCYENMPDTGKMLRRPSSIRRMRSQDVLLPEKYVLCGIRKGTSKWRRFRVHSTGYRSGQDETHLNFTCFTFCCATPSFHINTHIVFNVLCYRH
ncbi:hypothetical protein PMAYCL1PPCAC_09732, partial [Pristionchus mayeri]